MLIHTDAIHSGGQIESRYTCDSDNSSPELHWENAPQGTQSFALLVEDPDAPHGVFSHWVIYNIPAHIQHLPAGIPSQEVMQNGICQGLNSLGKLGYSGPCPPLGSAPHHYHFRLYALSLPPHLKTRLKREHLIQEISSSILTTTEVIGTYQREILKAG